MADAVVEALASWGEWVIGLLPVLALPEDVVELPPEAVQALQFLWYAVPWGDMVAGVLALLALRSLTLVVAALEAAGRKVGLG